MLTEAIRGEIEDQLRRLEGERDEKLRKTREIIESMRSLLDPRPGFTDKDLYDEEGNPIL